MVNEVWILFFVMVIFIIFIEKVIYDDKVTLKTVFNEFVEFIKNGAVVVIGLYLLIQVIIFIVNLAKYHAQGSG